MNVQSTTHCEPLPNTASAYLGEPPLLPDVSARSHFYPPFVGSKARLPDVVPIDCVVSSGHKSALFGHNLSTFFLAGGRVRQCLDSSVASERVPTGEETKLEVLRSERRKPKGRTKQPKLRVREIRGRSTRMNAYGIQGASERYTTSDQAAANLRLAPWFCAAVLLGMASFDRQEPNRKASAVGPWHPHRHGVKALVMSQQRGASLRNPHVQEDSGGLQVEGRFSVVRGIVGVGPAPDEKGPRPGSSDRCTLASFLVPIESKVACMCRGWA